MTTFKPLEAKAAEAAHGGEGDKAAEKTTNGDKKEDGEKEADSAGGLLQHVWDKKLCTLALYSLHGCCSAYSLIVLDNCTYASVVHGPGCLLTCSE